MKFVSRGFAKCQRLGMIALDPGVQKITVALLEHGKW